MAKFNNFSRDGIFESQCFHQNDDPFSTFGKTQNSIMGPFDLNSKVHFGQTYTWFLPTTTHSPIEYP